jgi:cardiolipin synthase C
MGSITLGIDARNAQTGATFRRIAIFGLALFLTACASLPQDVSRTPSHAQDGVPETRMARDLEPLLAANPELSGFRTLVQGEQAFAARLQLVAAAEKTIDSQYYIWHDDLTGQTMHAMLLKAADRGVRVRLLLDDLDTAGKDQLLRTIDAHPNIEIRLFNPFANRDMRAGDFVSDTRRVNRRMHNKTLTVDNIATIFGGRNIGDEYFDAAEEVAFADMDALGVGPIALDVSRQFDLYWNSEYVYPISAFDWESPITEDQVTALREISDTRLEAARASRYADVLREVSLARVERISEIDYVWSDWQLVYDQPGAITTNKVSKKTHLAPWILESMNNTREDLVIVSPYFVPGEKFTSELVALVERGVRVRILTNSLQANDVSLVHAGYMRYRKDLIRGGVELYEFRSTSNKVRRRLKRERIDAAKTSLHAKFFGYDEHYLFIGSFNLDGRSAKLNTELGTYFASPGQARELSTSLDETVLNFAYRVDFDDRGKLEWVGMVEGQEVRHSHEPDTSWWKRVSTGFLSYVVPESQL